MKCFSSLIFFVFILSKSWANVLYPMEKASEEITNGDTLEMAIDSKLTDQDLAKFEGKRVNEIIYVLEYQSHTQPKSFRVIVSNPPAKKAKTKYPFSLKNFDYKFDKELVPKEFIILKGDEYEISNNTVSIIGIVIVAVLFIAGFYLYGPLRKRYFRSKAKKANRERAQKLIDEFNNAKERADFERLYLQRREIKEYSENYDNKLDRFFKDLNKIQYRPEWSTVELEEIKQKKKDVGELRLARGI